MICYTPGKHTNQYTTDAICKNCKGVIKQETKMFRQPFYKISKFYSLKKLDGTQMVLELFKKKKSIVHTFIFWQDW
jgi:hypothetical protein